MLLFPSSALAVGVGVTPGKMEFTVRPCNTEVKTLYVINQSDEESLFQVYVEGKHGEWFHIMPGDFTLGPWEVIDVEIAVAPPFTAFTAADSHEFSICVVSLPPDSDLRIGAGVKVRTHVHLLGSPFMAVQWWLLIAFLLVAAIISLLFWWRWKARHA